MAPSNKKIVVILGATGAQGNPTSKYILSHSSSLYHVRALTRNPSAPIALDLASQGAEVLAADFSDEQALRTAFAGAAAIFANTNFFDQNSLELEVAQGKLVNKVASEMPTVEHFIFSALPDGTKVPDGEGRFSFRSILPYNSKAEIREDLRRNYPRLWERTTELRVQYYFQNWLKYGPVFGPQKRADETWVMSMPHDGSIPFPSASSTDTGRVVDAILRGGEKYFGKIVMTVGSIISDEEKLKIWADALGVKAVFEQVSPEEYQKRMESFGFPSHLAVSSTELSTAITHQQVGLEADKIVKASEIIPSSDKLMSWSDYVKAENWSAML